MDQQVRPWRVGQPLEEIKFKEKQIASPYFLATVYIQKREPLGDSLFCVTRLGLEPKTPSLKGMCSTC